MGNAPFEHGQYMADGGDVGGDDQMSAAPSRAFVQEREDGTFTVITEYAYVVPGVRHAMSDDFSPRRDGYAVQNQTEIMHCRDLDDIGGTEIDSDIEYDIINFMSINTKRDALSVARRYIRNLDISHYGWDD